MKNKSKVTMAIKCRANNLIHKLLNPKTCKTSEKWKSENRKERLTDLQKIALFDKIVLIDNKTSLELGSYLFNVREKKRVNKLRNAKGNRSKKNKTSKAEWEAMQNQAA